ncbi:hypothetical protein IQ269_06385 [Tychonema sp. LEGE 07199]|nr:MULTISPECIES: hypothetical protein [unclassified Tychonema]MBE9120445.1 hypothetical protein [Tychonema sp. LEGE 07199]MBE9131738.1 hypothetical protein [Tychonema sp. LEGE 07196]
MNFHNTKEEGRRKKEEGRGKKEEGRGKGEEGRGLLHKSLIEPVNRR